MVGTAEEAGELVEQARRHADELVLRPPENLGQLQPRRVGGISPVVAARSSRHKPAWIRKKATAACRLAELESPAPRGTLPAIAASNPEVKGVPSPPGSPSITPLT